jgi:hypothetical protein
MNLQEHIRKVLIEEFPQEDYSNQIIKNISAVDSILKALYPNFNKDGAHLKERRPLFWDSFLYECFDNKTLENYLGEDAATYVIDWFNSEFDTEAEHVTY